MKSVVGGLVVLVAGTNGGDQASPGAKSIMGRGGAQSLLSRSRNTGKGQVKTLPLARGQGGAVSPEEIIPMETHDFKDF